MLILHSPAKTKADPKAAAQAVLMAKNSLDLTDPAQDRLWGKLDEVQAELMGLSFARR